MANLDQPSKGQDVRLLHNNVTKLIDGINSFMNMTAQYKGRVMGIGRLNVYTGYSEVVIRASDPGEFGGIKQQPSFTIVGSEPNPSEHNQVVTFSASVPGATDGAGTIQFLIDGNDEGTYIVENQGASFTLSTLDPGPHLVQAFFSGDPFLLPSNGEETHVVNALPVPNMVLSSSENPANQGDSIDWGANLSNNTTPLPTGVVTFFIGDVNIGSAALSGGLAVSAVETANYPGHYLIEADYGGDSNWGQTFQTLDQVVRGTVLIEFAITPNPVAPNTPFNIYIQVSGYYGIPTGTIQIFKDGSAWGGPATLDGTGHVELTVPLGLGTGTYSIVVAYSGDGTYGQSESPPVSLVVRVSYVLGLTYINSPGSESTGEILVNPWLYMNPFNLPDHNIYYRMLLWDTPVGELFDADGNIEWSGVLNVNFNGYSEFDFYLGPAPPFPSNPPWFLTTVWCVYPSMSYYGIAGRIRLALVDQATNTVLQQANNLYYTEVGWTRPGEFDNLSWWWI